MNKTSEVDPAALTHAASATPEIGSIDADVVYMPVVNAVPMSVREAEYRREAAEREFRNALEELILVWGVTVQVTPEKEEDSIELIIGNNPDYSWAALLLENSLRMQKHAGVYNNLGCVYALLYAWDAAISSFAMAASPPYPIFLRRTKSQVALLIQ